MSVRGFPAGTKLITLAADHLSNVGILVQEGLLAGTYFYNVQARMVEDFFLKNRKARHITIAAQVLVFLLDVPKFIIGWTDFRRNGAAAMVFGPVSHYCTRSSLRSRSPFLFSLWLSQGRKARLVELVLLCHQSALGMSSAQSWTRSTQFACGQDRGRLHSGAADQILWLGSKRSCPRSRLINRQPQLQGSQVRDWAAWNQWHLRSKNFCFLIIPSRTQIGPRNSSAFDTTRIQRQDQQRIEQLAIRELSQAFGETSSDDTARSDKTRRALDSAQTG